jgi:GT2 family glycosyltransferase
MNDIADKKILVAVTTYNEIKLTEECIKSLQKSSNIDIILVDDYSEKDNLKILSEQYKIPFIGKVVHNGLTNSWNLAYKYFIENNYDIFFLSNNDIIFPHQTIQYMTQELYKTDCVIVVPSSTKLGAGKGCCQRLQGIETIPDCDLDINDVKNTQGIQDFLIEYNVYNNSRVDFFTGFLFGMRREIQKYQHSNNNLFDPNRVNICNEIDLYHRIQKMSNRSMVLHCKNAFVFHYKAVTIDIKKRDDLKKLENKYK